ncbi:MAG: hypothetical protein IID45_06875, partial [Planctomycetes bacterium]|nr:hypothetical protein [Planctomycetota bacterium]
MHELNGVVSSPVSAAAVADEHNGNGHATSEKGTGPGSGTGPERGTKLEGGTAMNVDPYFCPADTDPFETVTWELRTASIK